MTKEKLISEFIELCQPLFKFLKENHDPHTTIIINSSTAEVVQGLYSAIPIVKDEVSKTDPLTISDEPHEIETAAKYKGVSELSIHIAKEFVGNNREYVYSWIEKSRGQKFEIIIE